MYNLFLEFILEEYIEQNNIPLRCCGSCQGGCSNLAICVFMCFGIENKDIKSWYDMNKEEINAKWEFKQQLEYEEYEENKEYEEYEENEEYEEYEDYYDNADLA